MSPKISGALIASISLVFASCVVWSQVAHAEQEQSEQPAASAAPAKKDLKRLSAFPEDVAGLQQLAIESYQAGEWLRFLQATIKLREQRPYDQQYMVGMVVGASMLEKLNTAYNYMHVMQQQGLSYDFDATENTENIRGTEVYIYINDLLIRAGQPMGEGRIAFTLPDSPVHPEVIAWDESRDRFLVGTIDSGAVLAVSTNGEVEELLRSTDENGLMAITGMVVDAARGRLWLTSAGVPGFSGLKNEQFGRGALFEFDLASLALLNRFDLPDDGLPHVPGSAVMTPGGDIYFIDRAIPMVFRKTADSDSVTPFMASSDMSGFKDLAISSDGSILYIADAALGIMAVNIKAATTSMMIGPETLNFGGISGLMFSEGSLVMLQNENSPQRLMRLTLDPAGTAVTEVHPLAIALEFFTYPSFGTIHDGAIFYFADGNLPGSTDNSGITNVMKTPMVLSEEITSVELKKFNEETFGDKKEPQ